MNAKPIASSSSSAYMCAPQDFMTGRAERSTGVDVDGVQRPRIGRVGPSWPPSSSSPCTSSAASTRPTARCSRTSASRSTRAPRSACSAPNGAGQVVAAADHGGRRRRLHRRGPAHARASPSGCSQQEPQLDAAKDVLGNVMDGVGETATLLERYDEVLRGVGRPRRRLREARRASRPSSRTRSTPPTPGTSSARRDRHGRAALPAGRRRRHDALRRRAAPRRAVPAAAVAARPAAARRAHQPPRRRVGRVARAVPAGLPRHRRRRHPRPLLPRQRRRLDPRARPRPGHPVRGQLLVAGSSRSRRGSRQEEKQRRRPRQRTLERELEWVRMAPKARQAKGKARLAAYEKLLAEAEAADGARRPARDHDPARASASATS